MLTQFAELKGKGNAALSVCAICTLRIACAANFEFYGISNLTQVALFTKCLQLYKHHYSRIFFNFIFHKCVIHVGIIRARSIEKIMCNPYAASMQYIIICASCISAWLCNNVHIIILTYLRKKPADCVLRPDVAHIWINNKSKYNRGTWGKWNILLVCTAVIL